MLKSTFRIHSLGAFFRKAFRKDIKTLLKKIPYELIHDAKVEQYQLTGEIPEFAKFDI